MQPLDKRKSSAIKRHNKSQWHYRRNRGKTLYYPKLAKRQPRRPRAICSLKLS